MADILDGGVKYLVHHRLGQGGMGVVHLGTMVSHAGERRIALKRLSTKHEATSEANARIIAEARLVFQLTHPNICQVVDLAINDEGTFIVMEYVDGCDLKTLLRDGKVDVAAAVYVAREVADALDYAHRRKDDRGQPLWLIHGDVTPQNILLSREGEVKLADFGIARAVAHGDTEGPGNQLSAGTPGFMAPETLSGTIDQRADIYALGVSLYAALSGKSPSPSGVKPQTLPQDRPEVTQDLVDILERAVATRREDRYATASELQQALALFLSRRFPTFSRSALGEIVRARAETAPAFTGGGDGENVSLVSLTGTATFLSPMGFTDASETSDERPRGTRRVSTHAQVKQSRQKRWAIAAGAAAMLAVCGYAAMRNARVDRTNAATKPSESSGATTPTAAATTALSKTLLTSPSTTVPTTPESTGPSASPKTVAAHAPKVAAKPARSAPNEIGYLTINSEPWGTVFVDGHRFAEQTPVYHAAISAGAHKVSIYSPVKKASSPVRRVEVKPGKNLIVGFDW